MISVTIITLNEEKDLPSAMKSVKDLADEIIVVDSGSTDNTVKIAKEYGAKVYKRQFDDYASQKNFAAQKATGKWILSLDADEQVSPELAREIIDKLPDTVNVAFSIPRKNIILGKFIKHARWQPELDRHIWLWKKGFGNWEGEVHEELVVNGQVGRLKHPKIHHQYDTVEEFMTMINNYTEREANTLVSRGKKFSYLQLFVQPLYNFLVRYFYRYGFLDGWRGFILSYLMAFYHLSLWIKLWEKSK